MRNEFWGGMDNNAVLDIIVEFKTGTDVQNVFAQVKPENSGAMSETVWWATLSVSAIKHLATIETVISISPDSPSELIR